MNEEVVVFKSRNGQSLVGIATVPESAEAWNRTGMILLNTGIHYRVTWHRLNVLLARRLCSLGYTVFRFDPHGIGDSEGELLESGKMVDLFDAIQQGLFAEDTFSALDIFQQRYHADKVFLTGFCGGALTAMIAAGADKRVDGVVFVAGPVMVSSEMEFEVLHPVQAERLFQSYRNKLFDFRSWLRVLTLQSDYRLICSTLKARFARKSTEEKLIRGGGSEDSKEEGDRFNRVFLRAFKNFMERGKDLLFIFAELDPATWQFENVFEKRYLQDEDLRTRYDKRCQKVVIEKSNHTFSLEESQEVLFRTIVSWLEERRV